MQRARLQLFRNDFNQLIHFMNELRECCRTRNWERTISRSDDALAPLVRIQGNDYLAQVEKDQITGHIEDLKTIRSDISRHRSKDARKNVREATIRGLTEIVLSLIRIDERLKVSIWEELNFVKPA